MAEQRNDGDYGFSGRSREEGNYGGAGGEHGPVVDARSADGGLTDDPGAACG